MKLPQQIKDARKMLKESRLLMSRSKVHFFDGLEVIKNRAGGYKALSEKTGIPESTIKMAMRRDNIRGMENLAERLERVK